jgi:Alpha amylase, catalytic domain
MVASAVQERDHETCSSSRVDVGRHAPHHVFLPHTWATAGGSHCRLILLPRNVSRQEGRSNGTLLTQGAGGGTTKAGGESHDPTSSRLSRPLEANTEPVVGAQKPRAQSLQWFLSESTWDPDAVTQRRLELLRADPLTAPTAYGVVVIDEHGDRKWGTAIDDGSAVPLARLIPHLARIKRLGCNAVHILPFFASPLVDAGFDVSDYMKVRDDLGTIEDVRNIVHEAQKYGIRLFMDLGLNHASEEHQWFNRAQSRDDKYRRYFIMHTKRPRFVGTFHRNSAVWARYIVKGEAVDVTIGFPELAGEIPHQGGRTHFLGGDNTRFFIQNVPLTVPPGVFAASYRYGSSELLVLINITD